MKKLLFRFLSNYQVKDFVIETTSHLPWLLSPSLSLVEYHIESLK